MKNKAKFIPIVVVLTLLMSLVAIIPAMAAPSAAVQGTVDIVKSTDTTVSLTFARKGGTVILQVTDTDLDVPLKRVLVPSDSSVVTGVQNATAGSKTFTSDVNATELLVGDTVLFPGSERVKKIATRSTDGLTFTVTTAFASTHASVEATEVLTSGGTFANCPNCTNAPTIAIATGTDEQTFNLENFPQLDTNVGSALRNRFTGAPDTALNKLDARVVDAAAVDVANLSLNSLDAANGVLRVQLSVDGPATAYVLYWTSTQDTQGVAEQPLSTSIVSVKSQADESGIGVVLTESGASTGIFRATLDLSVGASNDDDGDVGTTDYVPNLKVGSSDVLTFTYVDASASSVAKALTIETQPTTFANLSPAHKAATTSPVPIVSGDVTDSGSGVNKTSLRAVFNVNGTVTTVDPNSGVTGSVVAITSGYTVQQQRPTTPAISDADVLWWLTSTDDAGNDGVSDSVAATTLTGTVATTVSSATVTGTGTLFTTELAVGQTVTVAGETRRVNTITDANSIVVDVAFTATAASQLAQKSTCDAASYAAIGTPTTADNGGCDPFVVKVDNTKPNMLSSETGLWWDATKTTTDKTEDTASKAKSDSIIVRFSEGVDATTLAISDFLVAGAQPVTLAHQSGSGSTAGCASGVTGCAVFLTVSALAPDAKPIVTLVSEVKDLAGNALTLDTTTSADGIGPTVTVTVTGTATGTVPATKDKVIIQISTNESATVDSSSVVVAPIATATTLGTSLPQVAPSIVSANTWQLEVTPTVAGVFNVYSTAKDLSANEGTAGHISDPSNSKAILFEKDVAVQVPTFTPATTDNPDSFLIIDFTTEGKEYGLDTNGDFTTTQANVVTDKDTHGKVTLNSATLDGISILSAINSEDKIIFLYKASGLTIGTHTVKIKATDESGRALAETSFTVKVTEKALFSVKLQPGWNMVSLPNSPADPAINSVISSSLPIDTVLTYDPNAQGGPWLTAVRDTDTGNLVGSLTSITAGSAYWIHTTTFQPIKVNIPGTSGGQQVTPPTITLNVGWNLVPTIDVTGTLVAGDPTTTTAAQYLTGVKFSRIYEYSTLSGQFSTVLSTATLTVGKGYWVYVTEAAVLVP